MVRIIILVNTLLAEDRLYWRLGIAGNLHPLVFPLLS